MSLLAKVFIVLQTLLVMAYLGMTASLYQHRRDWRTSYQKLNTRYTAMVQRGQKEISALRNYVKAKNELISAKETEVRNLKTELDRAQSDNHTLRKEKNDKERDIKKEKARAERAERKQEDYHRENERLKTRRDELTNALNIASARMEVAEGQVARLTDLTTALEADLANLRKSFSGNREKLRQAELLISMAEAAGVDFKTLLPGPPVPAIDGTVVAVKSDIKPALVLLSVGSDDRVEQGFHFSIYRKDKFVGKVVVERVLRDSAGCRVLFTAGDGEIKAGDNAATRLQ